MALGSAHPKLTLVYFRYARFHMTTLNLHIVIYLKERLPADSSTDVCDLFTFVSKVIKRFMIV